MTPRRFQNSVTRVLKPFKVIGVDARAVGIMVSISISFIPILMKELENVKFSLVSKGFRFSFWNVIRHSDYVLLPVVVSLVKKVSEIEYSMISKGYVVE